MYGVDGWEAELLLWMAIRPKETFGWVMTESALHID